MVEQSGQVNNQPLKNDQTSTSLPETPKNISSNSKQVYKKILFYLFIFVILVIAAFFVWTKVISPEMTKKQTDSEALDYESGFPLDHVSIQLPYDDDIQRYPLANFTASNVNVYLNIFEGLTIYRGTNLESGLAESWTNPDPFTWRFKLRRGVKFHLGDLLTTKDVKYTIEQAKSSTNTSVPWTTQLIAARIDSAKVIDDYNIELKTKTPDATLLSHLVWMGIVSQEQVKRDGLEKAVGTGPYKLVKLASREAMLQANNEYWGGEPKVKNLAYKAVFKNEEAKKLLENGELDITTLNSGNNNDLKLKGYTFSNFRTGGLNYFLLDLNSTKSKYITGTEKNPFKDIRVRKAMQLALNVPSLIRDAGLNAEPVNQYATPDLIGYDPQLNSPKPNLTQAKQLMTEAGYQDGFTVILDNDQQAEHVRTVEQVKKQLAKINIIIKVNTPNTDEFYRKFYSGDFSMMYMSIYPDSIDSLDLINTIFHSPMGSNGQYNVSNYYNKNVDAIIDQAKATFNLGKRVELTRQAHALIMEDIPSVLLYTETYQIFSRDNIAYKPSITAIMLGFDISGKQRK